MPGPDVGRCSTPEAGWPGASRHRRAVRARPGPDPPQPRCVRGRAPLGPRGPGPGPGPHRGGADAGLPRRAARGARGRARSRRPPSSGVPADVDRPRAQRHRGRRGRAPGPRHRPRGRRRRQQPRLPHGRLVRRGARWRRCAPRTSASTSDPGRRRRGLRGRRDRPHPPRRHRPDHVADGPRPARRRRSPRPWRPVPVLVDAAHVPGSLPGLDVEALGVAFWVGQPAQVGLHAARRSRRSGSRPSTARRCVRSSPPGATDCPSPSASTCRAPSTTRRGSPCPTASPPGHALGGWEQVQRNADLLLRGAEARAGRARHRQPARRHTLRPVPAARRAARGRGDDDRGRRGAVAAPVRRRLRRAAGRLRRAGLPPARRRALQRRGRLRAARGRAARGPRPPDTSMRPMSAGCGKIDRPPERCPRGGPAP